MSPITRLSITAVAASLSQLCFRNFPSLGWRAVLLGLHIESLFLRWRDFWEYSRLCYQTFVPSGAYDCAVGVAAASARFPTPKNTMTKGRQLL